MGTYYEDTDTLMVIEYCVKWYGNGKLYIDYVEVFDDNNDSLQVSGIWCQWLYNPQLVSNRIGEFLSLYSDWNNIRYWYVIDEPGSLDDFEPIRIIDSLVYHYSGRRVITQFTPKRLYEIGRLTSHTETYFDNLYDILISVRQNTNNKIYKKILNQLGSLSLIGKREIPAVIGEFDLVIQQNPNTTEAVYQK